ncbi:MAG: hypothetical protein MPN21_13580 [Thermoanaerobaculia bacterium]|nr:hypothetical protein [Thermoanaerobaculia bacterium]
MSRNDSRPRPVTTNRRSDLGPQAHAELRTRHRSAACGWLDRCLGSRCEHSWRQLLGRYGPRIRQIIVSMCAEHGLRIGRAEVDELSQDLYVRWLRRGRRFRGTSDGQFWQFVSTSIRHLVVDHLRGLATYKRSPEGDPWSQPLSMDDVEGGDLGSWSSLEKLSPRSPEACLARGQELENLRHRLESYCRRVVSDPRNVEMLMQAVLDGRSSMELSRVSAMAGHPVCRSTVDTWISRLRAALQADGQRLPRRPREPEGIWPPRVPVGGSERGVATTRLNGTRLAAHKGIA